MAGVRLIDLRTDLKSLRYGNDKPYVTKDINNPPTSNQTGMQINKRVDDLSRIAQMLVDRPGLKFIGNQALLQQTDTVEKLQKASSKGLKALGREALGIVKDTVIGTAKILGSTLAQVPVNGTGTHFVYGFRTDTYLQPSGGNTRSAFAQFFGAGGVEGAPLALKGELIEGEVKSNFGTKVSNTEFKVEVDSKYDYDEYFNKPRTDNKAKAEAQAGNPIKVQEGSVETTASPKSELRTSQNKIQSIPNTGISGSGLPLSDENLGKHYTSGSNYLGTDSLENIRRASNGKSIATKPTGNENEYLPNPYTRDNTFGDVVVGDITNENTGETVEGITVGETSIPRKINLNKLQEGINSGSIEVVSKSGDFFVDPPKIQDFRSGSSYSFDYNAPKINRETRVNLGNQGKVTFDRSNYGNTDIDTQDTLNKLNESTTRIDGTQAARDLAKLYFEVITPDGSTFLHFRAFIDSIDDSYNADWQGFNYVGRGEKFYTYGGFERDINISFKIAAATRAEMKPLYRKMVYLASSTAPTYGGQGFMRGTLARITVGSYFSQLPGVITSVKYSLIQDMPWEISMQNPEAGTDDDMQELPMGLQCSVSFKVIHDFAPQTGLYHYFTSPNPLNGSTSFLK